MFDNPLFKWVIMKDDHFLRDRAFIKDILELAALWTIGPVLL